MPFTVEIKHAGKQHKVSFDPLQDGKAFKESIYQVTGVPVERMKVMVKGGILKDDADLSKLAVKEGQVIQVIGTAGPLPQAPTQKAVFVEDMDDGDVAALTKQPPGLVNLGNTCYMNASLQALRSIPELQEALNNYNPLSSATGLTAFLPPGHSQSNPSARLTTQLSTLFKSMNGTTQAIPPMGFLGMLRMVAPQFAEVGQHGGYAQQDADEMWTQTISALHSSLSQNAGEGSSNSRGSFIDQYMSGDLQQTLTCDAAPEEEKTVKIEKVLKLDCNINEKINYMISGISESFDTKIEKNSPTLGTLATYTQTSRLARLPANLTVHMVRFFWRPEIQKKAKIMRKVKFPLDLDVTELLTDELRAKCRPVNLALKEIDKARISRAKDAKKRRNNPKAISANTSRSDTPGPSGTTENGNVPAAETGESSASGSGAAAMETDEVSEEVTRERERKQIKNLITAQGGEEKGANQSGLYELCAIVTHKGNSADSGHYIGWTRQETGDGIPGEEDWWKFDDDKVSVVPSSKIASLEGGGEDSVAYILLYRSKTI